MKSTFISLFLILVLVKAQENPFNKGVNLTNWFQVGSPTEIQFTKYTKSDFENIITLEADVIRLPINLHSMTSGPPDFELEPLFLSFLDQAIDWAEELEINILLDNHTFDPAVSTEVGIGSILVPVWQNMAKHFKDRSEFVYYEILNEPHGIDDTIWNTIQQSVIDAIREIDSVHTIVVGPAGWNSYNNLKYMPNYQDDNLLYTFHFYDPFLFTHQGANWTDPSLAPLSGVPFPYNAENMPAVPPELQGTWIAYAMNNYQYDGTISKVRELIDIAASFKEERGVPIFCGEFGVYMPNSDSNDRILWYSIVRNYFELKGIAWTIWDYHGGFGVFNQWGYGLFDHDLNTNLLSALGFNVPPQTEFELKPDSTGFGMYYDYLQQNVISVGNLGGIINFYNNASYNGNYCISWSNPTQYSSIAFGYVPIKDLSYLKLSNYYIGFWIKGDNPFSRFEIRFVDTKKDENDHPWRMSYAVDANAVEFNNQWQFVQIPFSEFEETGSWDNAWFPQQGLFDWSAIDRFEIVDEFGQLSASNLWFDDIIVFAPSSTDVLEDELTAKYELFQNYPNPFNPSTKISYQLNQKGRVRLVLYDVLGREIQTIVDEYKLAGKYIIDFQSASLSSGIYFYRLTVNEFSAIRQMVLLR